MANAYQESNLGGISYSTPIFSFGNTVPAINSGFSFDLPMATIQSFSNQALSFTANNAQANKTFLGNVINNAGRNVTATGDAAYNLQSQALQSINQISSNIKDVILKDISKRYSSGCFITTAICKSRNLPDNCDDLQTLRQYRDNILLKSDDGKVWVKIYYLVAPEIVESINRHDNSDEIYEMLNISYLQPAIRLIKEGDCEGAFYIYKSMVNTAAKFLV